MQTKAEQDQVTAQKLHDLGVPACINRFRPEVQAALAGPAPTKKPLTAIAAEIEAQPTKEALEEQRKLKSRGRVGKMLATKADREAAASGKTWDAATAKWIDPNQPKGDTTVKHQDGPKAQATRALREAKATGAAPAPAAKKEKATKALATASEKAKEPAKPKKPAAKATGKPAGKPKRTQAAKAAQAKKTAPAGSGATRAGSKTEAVVGLLTREKGCTMEDIKKATGWPTLSVPAVAAKAGLKLSKSKDEDGTTRYWGA